MANLNSGTTSYPGGLDTSPDLTDGSAGDEILSAHQDGRGAAIVALETELGLNPSGTVADVVTRLNVSQNADGTLLSSIIAQGSGADVDYAAGVFTIGWSPDGPGYTQNLGIEVTANAPVANAMRIRLVQRSGATPTSASPIRLGFKVSTVSAAPANGTYVVREITADTPLQLSSGSSLGTLVNETARIYIGALDTNGTVEAFAYNPKEIVASTTAARVVNLFRPSEVATYTTVAEGGAGGADSAVTLYSTSARTGIYIRRLGYVDVTLGSTVGNWSNNPTQVTLIGPGTPVTGDVIQLVSTTTGITRTFTDQIVLDGTIPQSDEGDLILWATMTHSNPTNPLGVDSLVYVSNGAGTQRMASHIHRQSEANAMLTASDNFSTANAAQPLPLRGLIATTTAGVTGYYLLCGANGGGTNTLNGEGAANLFGSSYGSYLSLTEICA